MHFLLGVLCTSAHKWEDIGTALGRSLGFLDSELKNISPAAGVKRRLKEMLSQWVYWATKNHVTPPTLEKLCDALRSQQVRLGDVADRIYEQKSCLPSLKKYD